MPDPSPAPQAGLVSDLHGAQGSGPAQGLGLVHKMLETSQDALKFGRIEDVYMDQHCSMVSIYGYRAKVPCFWLNDAFNRWFGSKKVAPPSVGSEVAVWLSNDHKYGVILGVKNAPAESGIRESTNLFGTPVTRDSDNEAHKSSEFGFDSFLVDHGDNIPKDVLPGDDVSLNAQGAAMALLELMTVIRGGHGCSVEAHVLDQLLRINGYNLQERTSAGERNVMEDNGFVTEEESGTHKLEESLGNGSGTIVNLSDGAAAKSDGTSEPGTNGVDSEKAMHARRWQNFRGFLGGLIQQFVLRPDGKPVDMSKAKDAPDLGLHQRSIHSSGFVVERSVIGGGMIKGIAIPVPKKKAAVDDPGGDNGPPEEEGIPLFAFSNTPGTRASEVCQFRDYLAWYFNKVLPARLGERGKDWDMPDESSCPTIGGDVNAPDVGGFYRGFPIRVNASSNSDKGTTVADDKDPFMASRGVAWCMVFPDGSVSLRDVWGSSIDMRGGHIEISASKEVRVVSGGNVVVLGGDDVVVKARSSVDVTATRKQIRLHSNDELFVHSEEGGMLFSTGSPGHQFSDKPGEERALPGICFKSANGGGVLIDAGQLTLNLSNMLFINQGEDGSYPSLSGRLNGAYLEMMNGTGAVFKFGNQYLGMFDGGIYGSGLVQFEGSIYIKGSAVFGAEPSFPGDWSQVPPLSQSMSPAFVGIDSYQYPYTIEELKKNHFVYRTVADYATKDGKWFQSFWQREMPGTESWEEKPAQDKSYPYPGEEHYKGTQQFWFYKEQNVTPIGRSVERKSLKPDPEGFTPHNWNSFPVHPSR